ncbi:MAG: amidohydrolase family protein [Myxococcales bacterium]|nr:amidohydrolase family protein [Myxococcales bacterium]
MQTRFFDTASIDYPIIDSDAHVNEPPNLWQDRVPAKWKERAPRVLETERGDIWSFDGGREKWPMGLTATAGQSFFQFSAVGGRYSEMRPGSFETAARLRDLDADGIFAQVLYPSVTLKGARIYSGERPLQLACVRAYNEWILEFCSDSNGRLISQAIIPTTGIEDAVAELEGAIKSGHRGAVISAFPNGSLNPASEDRAFWSVAQEAGYPIAIHIGSFLPDAPKAKGDAGQSWTGLRFVGRAAWTKAGGQTLDVVCDVLFSGIFEEFPDLKIVLVEANIGWIPTLLEQADDMFRRYRWYTGAVDKMTRMPSEIFYRNFFATFMLDSVGVEMRHRMNLDGIMWSTDYPHSGTDWPNSRITIERNFRGVPADEVKKMLHTNCRNLYGLDELPDSLPLA